MEKQPGREYFSALSGQNPADFPPAHFLRIFFTKRFAKMRAFGRTKRLIHIIPIRAIHQKWKEKPRKIKAFQQCAQVIHKVIHGFGEFVRGRIYTCFLRKMRKFTYKPLYHRWKEKGICTGKSYKGRGAFERRLWKAKAPLELSRKPILGWLVSAGCTKKGVNPADSSKLDPTVFPLFFCAFHARDHAVRDRPA